MTRDSFVLWLGIAAAFIGYLIADGRPPTVWQYGDWLKLVAMAVSTISGKLASSPLPHSAEVDKRDR